MELLAPNNLLLFMALVLFLLGIVVFLTGIALLTLYSGNKDIRSLIANTASAAQKGLAEDIASVIGNATSLLETLQRLTQTTNGVGLFLVVLGLVMIAASAWIVYDVVTVLP